MRPLYPLIFLLALSLSTASAQTIRGSIGGTVSDASHNLVTGATVSLTEEATGKKRTTVADTHGDFLVPTLAPGSYRLEVARAGYRSYLQDLTLALDQELRVDVALLAGNRTDTVEV